MEKNEKRIAENKPRDLFFGTKGVIILGLMIALTIVLTRFLSIQIGGAFRISLGSVCTVLTGLWFGPLAGAFAGAIADILGLAMAPSGAWIPLVTISAAFWGLLPGLFRKWINGSVKEKALKICLIVLATSVICQLLLTTAGLYQVYGAGILPGRLIQFAGSTPVYMLLISYLYLGPLSRVVLKEFTE